MSEEIKYGVPQAVITGKVKFTEEQRRKNDQNFEKLIKDKGVISEENFISDGRVILSQKEEFMKLKNYEEFELRRDEFKGLKIDADIITHMAKIFPKLTSNGLDEDGNIIELFKTPKGRDGN